MTIDDNLINLLKDKNVRHILQRIHEELNTNKSNYQVLAKLPSYIGKVELFNQNKPIDNDEYFLQFLINHEVINNLKFEIRDPNKGKNYIDDLLLNFPYEYKIPYIAISFNIVNTQFLKKLCETAVDVFTINPYPLETQKDIAFTTIVKTKALIQKNEFVLSKNEINKEDRSHIEILKTLRELEIDKKIKIVSFKYNLNINDNLQANILYTPQAPFTGKDILTYKSLSLDPFTRNVSYPKIKNKTKVTHFRDDNQYYRTLKESINPKKNYILTYTEIYLLMFPNNGKSKLPTHFERQHKRLIESVINYLKIKLNNNSLFTYIEDSYKLTP